MHGRYMLPMRFQWIHQSRRGDWAGPQHSCSYRAHKYAQELCTCSPIEDSNDAVRQAWSLSPSQTLVTRGTGASKDVPSVTQLRSDKAMISMTGAIWRCLSSQPCLNDTKKIKHTAQHRGGLVVLLRRRYHYLINTSGRLGMMCPPFSGSLN